jgi:mxaD protein
MKRIIIFLTALLFSSLIFSHGPTPQKVQESITVNVSPEEAWGLVKDFGSISKWHPAAKDTKIEKRGDDTYRIITLESGDKLDEKFRSIDEGLKKIRWEITKGNVPFTDFNAYIIVSKGANDSESVIQWTARFYRVYKLNPPIPEGQDDATAKAAVQNIVDNGLLGLKKTLESK